MEISNIIQIGKKFFEKGDYENALKIFLKIYEKGIIQKDVLYFIAFSYSQKGAYLQAIYFIKISEKEIGFDRNIFLLRNLMFLNFGKYDKQILSFNYLQGLAIEFEFVCVSNIYRNEGNYKKSLEILRDGLQKFPKSSRILYNFSLILNILGRKKEALFFAYKSYKIDGYLYSLDLFLRILKNFGIKKEKIKKIFEKINLDFKAHQNDSACIGNIFYILGDFDKSEIFYKKSILDTKYDFYAYNGLANIYFQRGDLQKSKIYYKFSLKINRNNFYAYNGLAKIFLNEGKIDFAEKIFQKSLKINKNNFEALKGLGIFCYKNGDFCQAKVFLKKSNIFNNKDFMVKRYLKKISYVAK